MFLLQEKIVVVTRKTRLEELRERFNTRKQAKFYIEHMGLDFSEYDDEHNTYADAVRRVKEDLGGLGRRLQFIDWTFLPNFLFAPSDVVVTVGRDGLVVNTAKYLDGQPLVAINPDPARIDGILVPFRVNTARDAVARIFAGRAQSTSITMAEVALNDGQRLLAFNDFFIGQRTHVSARYSLTWRGKSESQSSSGVLVSTGAGSTGWLSSTGHMAAAVTALARGEDGPESLPPLRMEWEDSRLAFVVREPFRSQTSDVRLTAGLLEAEEELVLESYMPENGVIFSDGVEADPLAFNSGAVATIRVSKKRTQLVK